jgi:hypothetical protein
VDRHGSSLHDDETTDDLIRQLDSLTQRDEIFQRRLTTMYTRGHEKIRGAKTGWTYILEYPSSMDRTLIPFLS